MSGFTDSVYTKGLNNLLIEGKRQVKLLIRGPGLMVVTNGVGLCEKN